MFGAEIQSVELIYLMLLFSMSVWVSHPLLWREAVGFQLLSAERDGEWISHAGRQNYIKNSSLLPHSQWCRLISPFYSLYPRSSPQSLSLIFSLYLEKEKKKILQIHRNVQSQASQMDFNHLGDHISEVNCSHIYAPFV